MTPRVIIESPYAARTVQGLVVRRNYLKACVQDSMERGESPLAGHGFYTQFLNDRDPRARKIGMTLAKQWMYVCHFVAVYLNYGWSPGMVEGVRLARLVGKPVEERHLPPGTWDEDAPKHRD